MQSDDENFEESLETLTPERKIQNPGDRFPLRPTPARKESVTAQNGSRKFVRKSSHKTFC